MKDIIEIKISNKTYTPFILSVFNQLQSRLHQTNLSPLKEALSILLDNVTQHAYDRAYEIELNVRFIIQSCDLRIDVQDKGFPFDFTPYLSQDLEQKYKKNVGIMRIYDLVDELIYEDMRNKGKCLTLIQHFNLCYDLKKDTVKIQTYDKKDVLAHLHVRTFLMGDGDGIAKLIYRNYNFSYYKEIFYIPYRVRQANENKTVTSIVAYYKKELIGHFALLHSKHSNIAEIGVATVDPRFKRMGIMNLMFDELILTAKKEGLSAIYGEALTMHPFSQKANLRHNMTESAISLGTIPSSMEIEQSIKTAQKSGAMIAFLLFNPKPRKLFLPALYKKEILKVYTRAQVSVHKAEQKKVQRDNLTVFINQTLNAGIIIIEESFHTQEFVQNFEKLRHQKRDMIFADINLNSIKEIDEVISILNNLCFFYSGVLFEYYFNEDYLRLQYINSLDIDIQGIICYSDDANEMMEFIRDDYQRVSL